MKHQAQQAHALRRRVYQIVEVARPGDRASAAFDLLIITLILANIASFIIESMEAVRAMAATFFWWFEAVSVAVFTGEYVLRVWSCAEIERYRDPLGGRLRFSLRPLLLVDLLAILPFYLPFLAVDLRVLRAFRVMRLARMAKLGRYSTALSLIYRVLRSRRVELITTASIMLLLLLLAATFMYFAERDAQPELFGSIPASMWWAVMTLTTVGYGDTFPITPIGKLMAAVCAVLGVGMFALPTGILGAAFVEELSRSKRAAGPGSTRPAAEVGLRTCPTCGRPLPEASG